ncbi:Zinc finger, CCHC-type [Sesbania bispinosa]|nr:Zinc finger, CCHC-type [Sesbania bispinosa]
MQGSATQRNLSVRRAIYRSLSSLVPFWCIMTQRNAPPIVIFTEEDVVEGVSRCQKSIVGKFISTKPVHVNSLQNALSESDLERVLKGSPWIFKNYWLCLQRWDRNLEPGSLNFSTVPLKIQIWGLPFHCRSVSMGRRIGACLGEVKQSNIFESREKGSFIKVLVDFDLSKPLLAGVNVGSQVDGIMWVDFRYERLPQFCYSCGLIGHEEDDCENVHVQAERDGQEESTLGPWLRSSVLGRKVVENNRESESKADKHSRPKRKNVPKEVLNMLSSLSINKENSVVTSVAASSTLDSEHTPNHESNNCDLGHTDLGSPTQTHKVVSEFVTLGAEKEAMNNKLGK